MNERRWSQEIKALGDRLAALTVPAAVELDEYLEKVHGVKAAAVISLVQPDQIIEPELPPARPTAFQVMLEGYETARRINVIRLVRELTGLGIKEARELVEGTPRIFKEGLALEEADRLKAQLETAGAKASVQPMTG
jgi:large subunit ribosomal protein L7/L12